MAHRPGPVARAARHPTRAQPFRRIELRRGEIHLWQTALDGDRQVLRTLEPSLSPDERVRADRFHFQLDRDRYVLAHGALRSILARYLAILPGQVAFRYGPRGKPELVNDTLRFSLSHSHDLVAFAIARSGHPGIDIERLGPGAGEQVAGFLSPTARRILESLPRAARRHAFLRGWTRMEAQAKACGEGLDTSLERFHRFLARGNRVLLPSSGHAGRHEHWWFHDFSPRRGFAGAVAVQGRGSGLRFWRWAADEQFDSDRSRSGDQDSIPQRYE